MVYNKDTQFDRRMDIQQTHSWRKMVFWSS